MLHALLALATWAFRPDSQWIAYPTRMWAVLGGSTSTGGPFGKMLAHKVAAIGAPRKQPQPPKCPSLARTDPPPRKRASLFGHLQMEGAQSSTTRLAGTKRLASTVGTSAKPPNGDHKMVVSPGPVFESMEAHKKRHRGLGLKQLCLRCQYSKNPGVFCQNALLPTDHGRALTWLEPRPEYLGGAWGLGCRVCAWYHRAGGRLGQPAIGGHQKHTISGRQKQASGGQMKQAIGGCKKQAIGGQAKRATGGPKILKKILKKGTPRQGPRFTKFARFQWSSAKKQKDIAEALKQHSNSQAHKIACAAMLRNQSQLDLGGPNSSGFVLSPAPPMKAPAPLPNAFRGRVPQPKDWLDGFVDTKEHVSFRAQERMTKAKSGRGTENPAPQDPAQEVTAVRGRPLAAARFFDEFLRKRRRKQTMIMAEGIRVRHRKVLRAATFCTLALDEAQGRKLFRFRCDRNQAPWSYTGVLGVFEMGPKSMEEGEQDHAERALTRVDEFITRFCTPIGTLDDRAPACDQELKDHILKIVSTLSADGGPAERRALFLAFERCFVNLKLLIRDSAHAIRIAMKDPLHHDTLFGEVWEELFDKRHAVVPDMQNSGKLKELLLHAQRDGAKPLGLPAGLQPMQTVPN